MCWCKNKILKAAYIGACYCHVVMLGEVVQAMQKCLRPGTVPEALGACQCTWRKPTDFPSQWLQCGEFTNKKEKVYHCVMVCNTMQPKGLNLGFASPWVKSLSLFFVFSGTSCALWSGVLCLNPATSGVYKTSQWGSPSSSTQIWLSRHQNFWDVDLRRRTYKVLAFLNAVNAEDPLGQPLFQIISNIGQSLVTCASLKWMKIKHSNSNCLFHFYMTFSFVIMT